MRIEATLRDHVESRVLDKHPSAVTVYTNERGLPDMAEKLDEDLGLSVKVVDGKTLLTSKQLCTYLGISRTWLYNIRKKDDSFPDPVKIGVSERMYWRKDQIDDFVNQREQGIRK